MTNKMKENKNTDAVAQARVEGAREALTACAMMFRADHERGAAQYVEMIRDREYPAVPEGGERPTPTPEREETVAKVEWKLRADSAPEEVMRLTPDGRVIVHLAAALRASERASSLAVCGIAAHGGHVPPQALADYGSDSLNGVLALRAEKARLVKEADDLSEANWIMQKRLAMAEAEIVRLGGGVVGV